MAETTKVKVRFNSTWQRSIVTADDVATLDSVYGTRAKPIYVSCDEAIATKENRRHHFLLQHFFTENEIASMKHTLASIMDGSGRLVLIPCEKTPPHDWPHESLLSSGEASQSPASTPSPAPTPPPAPAYNIDSVVDFASLIPVAHAMAIDKGWWQDGIASRDMNEIIANYHAEVSEAWEEYRAGRMETWTNTDGKPEGFWVEIADLLIRMADSCGAGKHGYSQSKFPETFRFIRTIASDITAIHWLISVECESVVEYCLKFSKRKKVDLFAIVRQKLAYNATRPHRHGGKKA